MFNAPHLHPTLQDHSHPQLVTRGAGHSAVARFGVAKVRQRMRTDCGVACLAMVAGTSYEEAAAAFEAAGLHLQRQNKKPYMSNFRDLVAAASHLGLQLRRRPYRGWSEVRSPTIVKVVPASSVAGLSKRDWHWVVAHRTESGIAIEDPASEYSSFENPPPLANTVDFDWYRPFGAVLSPANVSVLSGSLIESHAASSEKTSGEIVADAAAHC